MAYRKGWSHANSQPQLKLDKMHKLDLLFKHHNWPTDRNVDRSLYSRFCKTLMLLTDHLQDFLIELTKGFIWINGKEYNDILIDLVKTVRSTYPDKTIYYVPCKHHDEFTNIKSSDYVWYTLRDNIFHYELELGKYEMKSNYEEVSENELLAGNAIVVLVDDFIGSGGTAVKTLAGMRAWFPHLRDNTAIKVMSLVAQGDGIKQLKDAGVDVYYSRYAPKAIEESDATDDEKIRMYYQMEDIESRIPSFNKTYHYGYNKSEALVSMIRCPNNTFPIYWYIPNVSPYERIQ